jgi:hypothetical protein
MPSIFTLPLANWELAGVEAPAGQRRWMPDQKPPADWWNYFFNTTITSLHEIDTELQGARGAYPTTNDRLIAMAAGSAGHANTTGNPHGTEHAQTGPEQVNPADTNATRDKHVSNADAKGWQDHKNATGNAHGMTHAQLTSITGAISGTDTSQTKHISDANFKSWSDHVAAGAPHTGHAVAARQIITPAGGYITGGGDLSADRTLTIDASAIRMASTLGLRIEARGSDPGAPQTGQIWLRTDL